MLIFDDMGDGGVWMVITSAEFIIFLFRIFYKIRKSKKINTNVYVSMGGGVRAFLTFADEGEGEGNHCKKICLRNT